MSRVCFIISMLVTALFAQVGIDWQHFYGQDNAEVCYAGINDLNGGSILAGSKVTNPAGTEDAWLVRVDRTGNQLWEMSYGGRLTDRFRDIIRTVDGGYLAVGTTNSFNTRGFDVYLVKTDTSGSVVWETWFGTGLKDEGYAISHTVDGGYIITGTSEGVLESEVYTVKIDNIGNVVWEHLYREEDTRFNVGNSVFTEENGYIIFGTAWNNSGYEESISFNLDLNGILWNVRGMYGRSNKTVRNPEGGFISLGWRQDTSGNKNLMIAWKGDLGGMSEIQLLDMGDDAEATDLVFLPSGNYTVSARIGSGVTSHIELLKFDRHRDLLWQESFDNPGIDEPADLKLIYGGRYLLCGTSVQTIGDESDFWLMRTGMDEEFLLNADFQAAPTQGLNTINTRFHDRSTGNPVFWSWDFGDGDTSTAQNPLHQYTAGFYSVTLIVTDLDCNADTLTKPYYINVEKAEISDPDVEWFHIGGETGFGQIEDALWLEGEGYIVTGFGPSENGDNDVFLGLITENGELDFLYYYAYPGEQKAYAFDRTPDGGFIITGSGEALSGSGENDLYLMKLRQNYTLEWHTFYGNDCSGLGDAVQALPDGKFVVAGLKHSLVNYVDYGWLVKFDESGSVVWDESFGGDAPDRFVDVVRCANGDILACGETFSGGDPSTGNFWVVRTDNDGNEIWNREYGDGPNVSDKSSKILELQDGTLALAGSSSSWGASRWDFMLIKLSSVGDEIWHSFHGLLRNDACMDMALDNQGNFILAGKTLREWGHDDQAYFMKFDPNGNFVWEDTVGTGLPEQEFNEESFALVVNNSGYFLGGVSDFYGEDRAFAVKFGPEQAQRIRADFSASPRRALPGQPISFYDESSGNPVSWFWDFGDGVFSTEPSPTYNYNDFGEYSVKLITTYADGYQDIEFKNDYIHIQAGPPNPEILTVVINFDENGTPQLSWDTPSGNISEYKVYASHSPVIELTPDYLIATVNTNSFSDFRGEEQQYYVVTFVNNRP